MAIKAIIMATAIHNIEGDRRLSEEDGAGSIDAALADSVAQVRGNNAQTCGGPCWWMIATTTNNPAIGSENAQTFQANRGERIRVAIGWWSLAGDSTYPTIGPDALATNFDLRVYRPSDTFFQTPVASSTSTYNNYEIVDFIAPETGTYTIRVRKQSATEERNTLAIAWVSMGTYLPDVRSNDGWAGTIYVRNDGRTDWAGRVTFYNQSGSYYTEASTTLGMNRVWPVNAPSNWRGTAIVTGNDDISVVVRHEKSGMATLDNGYATGGATDPAWGQASTMLYTPDLYNNIYGGYTSELAFTHAGATGINVNFVLPGRSGFDNYLAGYYMGANNQQVIPLSTFISGSWVGSLQATSGQPLALRLFDGRPGLEGRTNNATAVGRNTLYIPAAYRFFGAASMTTAIVIQNLSSTASTDVTLRYCITSVPDPSQCPASVVAIAPLRAVGVNLANAPIPNPPASWAGSVSLQSSGSVPISAVYSNANAGDAYSVSATGYGSKLIILPRAARNAGGRTTGFTIRNVSGQPNVEVTARYYATDGGLSWTRPTITLQPAQVYGAHQSLDEVPDGWEGSIVLEATRDIVAILREETSTTFAAYNGISR